MASEPITFQRAAWMRRHLTPPEAQLWRYLKGGNLGGVLAAIREAVQPR